MSATEFSVDTTDLQFVLFDQLKIHESLAKIPKYAEWDRETSWSIIEEAIRLSTEVLSPLNGPGDRQGCSLDGDGNVTTPDGFKDAWELVKDGGWVGLSAEAEWGGMGAPPVLHMITNEIFNGAACAFWMYPGLTGAAARVVATFGPEGRNVTWAEKMFAGDWGGTMCLTEAGAGTAVGDNRCKATPVEGQPGTYLLEGEKIFISGGDNDFTENIIHLVLAKTPGAPEGTRGISLFLVPKFLVNDDLSIGERNGAKVVGIEHKMGINGNATCTIALGAEKPCVAYLIGDEFEGMRLMFHMMNEARIGVGSQGVAIGAAAYQYALAYSKERIQGSAIENMRDEDAPRVAIVEHPDVRRMLMWQKCQVEAMRSLIARMAMRVAEAEAATDPATKGKLEGQVELLVPILKAHCSDTGFEIAVSAVQCYGGYGYIGEYPVEQLVRDAKIFSIYEGTNGVQAMDLIGRKLRMKGGQYLMDWMGESLEACTKAKAAGFVDEASAVEKAVQHCGATAMHLGGLGMQGKLALTMLQATRFQRMMGLTVLGVESMNQAVVAKAKMAASGETNFLAGKLLNAKYYTANILPEALFIAKSIQANDDSALDKRLFAED